MDDGWKLAKAHNEHASRTPYLMGLVIGVLALAGLALAGMGLRQAVQAKVMRCYLVEPPLTHTNEKLLAGKLYECAWHVCRAVVKLDSEHGLACYFPSPLPPGNSGNTVYIQSEAAHGVATTARASGNSTTAP